MAIRGLDSRSGEMKVETPSDILSSESGTGSRDLLLVITFLTRSRAVIRANSSPPGLDEPWFDPAMRRVCGERLKLF